MSLYDRLYGAFTSCYKSELSKQNIQGKTNDCWRGFKEKFKQPKELEEHVLEKIKELQQLATKKSSRLLSFFSKLPTPSLAGTSRVQEPEKEGPHQPCSESADALAVTSDVPSTSSLSPATESADSPVKEAGARKGTVPRLIISSDEDEAVRDADDPAEDPPIPVRMRTYTAPVQQMLQQKINILQKEYTAAVEARDSGLGGPHSSNRVDQLRKKLKLEENNLKRAKGSADRMKKYRASEREKKKKLCALNPEASKILKIREEPGRPRLEDSQPELLNAICNIATFGGSADARRRSDQIRSCKTLSDLQSALTAAGFQISRSATYLRLTPKNHLTSEGKRHVTTVPVRLCRPDTDLHKGHSDGKFCVATIRSFETLASILGSKQVAFLSQDDKARVPIGITAAQKQAPMLMHMQYRVRLPDHDWVVAARHKLIPSVYAGITISEDAPGQPEAVGYSGPTYIAIRSAKHSSSTAFTHAQDLERLLQIEDFDSILKVNGEMKPILMQSVDGGPDENPRYEKVIAHGISHFRKYNLDALFIFTNAPGRSAFNRVERRMAPLSRELVGLIIPHEHFGSHLRNGKTVDPDLERENFAHAGRTLSEVWSGLTIDGYPVHAEYIEPQQQSAEEIERPSEAWYAKHVRESQYLLQVSKCTDGNCCSPHRSDLRRVLPDGFMLPPYPVQRTPSGLVIPPPEEAGDCKFASFLVRKAVDKQPRLPGLKVLPYDAYCPSVRSAVRDRSCSHCHLYFASKKRAELHRRALHFGTPQLIPKIRLKRVIARREDEVMGLVEEETGDSNVEWFIVDDVEMTNEDETSPETITNAPDEALISSLDDYLKVPWTPEDQLI